VSGAFAAHVVAGEPPEIGEHELEEPGFAAAVAFAPQFEETRNSAVTFAHAHSPRLGYLPFISTV
jgi:hypothetical protein